MLAHPIAPVAFTADETAEVLGVTRQTVYQLVKRGQLRIYKVGRSTRFNAREVLALVGGEGGPDVPAA